MTIRTIIDELKEYGYSDRELANIEGLDYLLLSVKQYCIKPNSPDWIKYEIEKKYGPLDSHYDGKDRMHFCNCCGEPIKLGIPSNTNKNKCPDSPTGLHSES